MCTMLGFLLNASLGDGALMCFLPGFGSRFAHVHSAGLCAIHVGMGVCDHFLLLNVSVSLHSLLLRRVDHGSDCAKIKACGCLGSSHEARAWEEEAGSAGIFWSCSFAPGPRSKSCLFAPGPRSKGDEAGHEEGLFKNITVHA